MTPEQVSQILNDEMVDAVMTPPPPPHPPPLMTHPQPRSRERERGRGRSTFPLTLGGKAPPVPTYDMRVERKIIVMPSPPRSPPSPPPVPLSPLPLSPLAPLAPPPAMWISREALAEAGHCLAQNGARQPVQTNTFVCVGGGGGGGGGAHSASEAVEPEPEDPAACEFVRWPLDPLSGALLPFWAEHARGGHHARDKSGAGGGAVSGILSVIGDACYSAETLAAWVKEDAHLRGVPLALARVSLPASGASVCSHLLHRAATLGGEAALDTLLAKEEAC